jgi:hypothetical protein
MTVDGLYEKLEYFRLIGLGKLPVVIEADHGQSPMHASWCGVDQVADLGEYVMDRLPDDEDGEKVIMIQAY